MDAYYAAEESAPRGAANNAMPLRRSASRLVRPERAVDPQFNAGNGHEQQGRWAAFARGVTCCIPVCCIGRWSSEVQQAWREKVTIVMIILLLCASLAFITFGLQSALCGSATKVNRVAFNAPNLDSSATAMYGVGGTWYALGDATIGSGKQSDGTTTGANVLVDFAGAGTRDVTPLFVNVFSASGECLAKLGGRIPRVTDCKLGKISGCVDMTATELSQYSLAMSVTYEWEDLTPERGYFVVYNGSVLNVQSYVDASFDYFGPALNDIIRTSRGKDITLHVHHSAEAYDRIECMVELFRTGSLSKTTPNCFAAVAINYLVLAIILGLVVARIAMAIIYTWFLANGRTRTPAGPTYNPPGYRMNKKRYTSKPSIASSGGAASRSTVAFVNKKSNTMAAPAISQAAMDALRNGHDPFLPFVVMMVTCYSEGEEGLRATLESLADTDYADHNKLFMIIADGIVDCGETDSQGRKLTTADICVNLLRLDDRNRFAEPMAYVAVAEGSKQLNYAKVHAGYFDHNDHSVPAILIVKCGTPEEQHENKPGNRGKRDSQIILMQFFSKVMFDDRMSPLEYDIFCKLKEVTMVQPEMYEMVLMVDADTKVAPPALGMMVNVMRNDVSVMGVCGETQIANKTASWVTAIQTYEYYVSHHLSKSFESMFGGVTCLPGCFSCYRIKAPKGSDGYWVPILANPDVVTKYSENVVDTLHKKNLLHLGEDRYLSTLMLSQFPKRHTLFVPQAVCETVVPDKFSVLLSQRRRWINSTVHNLFELVFVKDLCGTAVVFLDLIGTLVLPAAIIFTGVLIYSIATPQTSFLEESVLPLVMLLVILVLPSIMILVNAHNIQYFGWMLIYLCALIIWNFVLPVYSFWHMDDFSWGKTRDVGGESKNEAHRRDGVFDSRGLRMRRWQDWERELESSNVPMHHHNPDSAIMPPDTTAQFMFTSTQHVQARNSQVSAQGSSVSYRGQNQGSLFTAPSRRSNVATRDRNSSNSHLVMEQSYDGTSTDEYAMTESQRASNRMPFNGLTMPLHEQGARGPSSESASFAPTATPVIDTLAPPPLHPRPVFNRPASFVFGGAHAENGDAASGAP